MGLLAGVIYFSGTLYWITQVMAMYGGLSTPVAVVINATLIAYLALFPALFGLAMARVTSGGGVRMLLVAPFVWVATEMGRMYVLTGFPWVLLGYSQASMLPIAQLASIVGVFGLSALLAAISASLAVVVVDTRRARVAYLPLAVTMTVVILVGVWGSFRITRGTLTHSGEAVRVGLIQGNVDQADKWDDRRARQIFHSYLEMTRQAMSQGAQVVLWPESSTPFFFGEDRAGTEEVRTLARQAQVPIILGSDQIERGTVTKYYNAAFLVRSDGSNGGVYRKMHLVPFGEYVPAKRLFFFMERLVQAVSDFTPGDESTLLSVDGHPVSTSICYEVVYPALVRQFVQNGSELLTTITNDAWFGQTSAPYQHFAQASLRAIENGRYLVRSANTGISGIVDPYGRVLEESRIFTPAVVVGDARFLHDRTIYTRIGDVVAYFSLIATVALLFVVRRRVQ
jgi:apolipoprotein N-acyltransferase